MSVDVLHTKIKGHVQIKDSKSGEVYLDKFNAIHSKNMSIALSRGLANSSNSNIFKLKLGNGGVSSSTGSSIVYLSPNVSASNASLYSQSWEQIIDESVLGVPVGNSVFNQTSVNDLYSVVICSAIIPAESPPDQKVNDIDVNNISDYKYAFNELGLFTQDDLLLTHIIFPPIIKTSARELVITYTLTVYVE